jgi:hypothetical protein
MNCVFYPKDGFAEGNGIAVEKVIYPRPGDRYKCPQTEGETHLVLQLKSIPPARTHYDIANPKLISLSYDEKVTVVLAQSFDFLRKNPANGLWAMPKNLSNCNLKDVTNMPYADNFDSACGSADGASGGAVLDSLATPLLLGTIVDNHEFLTKQELIQIARTGKTDRRPYNASSWKTGNLAITEEVYQAIKDAAEQQVAPNGEH